MKKRTLVRLFFVVIIAFCAGLSGAIAYWRMAIAPELAQLSTQKVYSAPPARYSSAMAAAESISFVRASETARPSVVYIKVLSEAQRSGWDPFWDFFGNIGPVSSSGSGVIISSDGYIVTNSHVVKDAQKIEVVMNNNKRSFLAKVVGADPSSDLALLKIEGKDLPAIEFADSDQLPIGDWVLAVGNPFNLTSTVTAGIVSAKGRNIRLVQNQFPIESFIQTDAAINPGNSGGALVNASGRLVGINTAIFSKTGSYTGYGFAIPANIVRKVIRDIKEFGYVQRAFLEAEVSDIDETLADRIGGDNVNGVYVRTVYQSGNAAGAGLKSGDLIVKVNDAVIDSRAVFDEQLAYHRPGDQVKLTVKRGNDTKEMSVLLTNMDGTTSLEKASSSHSEILGADFLPLSKIEREKYSVEGGIKVFNIGNGRIRQMNLPEGYAITSLNGRTYTEPAPLIKDLETARGRIIIQGITPEGTKTKYSFYSY